MKALLPSSGIYSCLMSDGTLLSYTQSVHDFFEVNNSGKTESFRMLIIDQSNYIVGCDPAVENSIKVIHSPSKINL